MARRIRTSRNQDDLSLRQKLEALFREWILILNQDKPAAERLSIPDPIDFARAQEEERVWLAVLERSQEMQTAMREALNRLAKGEYGLCSVCHENIPRPRLRALPFAVRCLSCQERWEMAADRAARLSRRERPAEPSVNLDAA